MALVIKSELSFEREIARVSEFLGARLSGHVVNVTGLRAECRGLSVPLGSLCRIQPRDGQQDVEAEVVGFRDELTVLMPYEDMRGVTPGDLVSLVTKHPRVPVGDALLGRVLDARGRPLDAKGRLYITDQRPLAGDPPSVMGRRRIREPLATGVTVIDAFTTIGRGQRMGLFAGSGVGKSVLLGMIARGTAADVNVIALVGERGREVREFVERDLGEEGLRRSVVVVATSNESALARVRAAFVATAVAEHFRERGKHVLLMMDSITRFALAQREIGLAAGEPPATKGFPPSVFALLPRLCERAGMGEQGSITGIYSVLVEADDVNEPISDAMRGILDGHLWLGRELAHRGHYPAVDVLQSISRCMVDVTERPQQRAATHVRGLLAAHRQAEDLINIGAYVGGSNPRIDEAIRLMPNIERVLRQEIMEERRYEDSVQAVKMVGAGGLGAEDLKMAS